MKDSVSLDTISEREFEVIQLLFEDLSNQEIAQHLFLATSAVKWYIRQINSKFHTANREEIVRHAYQSGCSLAHHFGTWWNG